MQIKPIFPKSYIVRYSRGKDLQTTELVDATSEEVHKLIADTFKGRFAQPRNSTGNVPYTTMQVVVLDNIRKRSEISQFTYTKNGKEFKRPFVRIYNLSPREARIEIEKAIREHKI